MTPKNLKLFLDTLEKSLTELSIKLERDGGQMSLLKEYDALFADIVGAVLHTRNTTASKRGRELNKSAGNLHERIISAIPLNKLESAAKDGDNEAAWLLASKFDNKLGVTDDWLKENQDNYFKWSEQALIGCEQKGLSWRKWNLAYDYIEVENFKRAKELLLQALDEGEVHAATMLGELYSTGNSEMEADGQKAQHYYELAIAQGDEIAMNALARMYFTGHLLEEDERQAFLLTNRAAKLGNEEAKEFLSSCYFYGWGTRANTPKAVKLMLELGPDYSIENNYLLANAYLHGEGVKQDIKKGLNLLKRASAEDSAAAKERLAIIYSDGDIVRQNKKLSFQYFQEASNLDGASSQTYLGLGIAYLYGYGCQKDGELAEHWFKMAYNEPTIESHKMEALVYLEDYMGIAMEVQDGDK